MELRNKVSNVTSRYWIKFIGKTAFYTIILLALIYLYEYSQVGGGSFIYNQF